MNACDDNNNRTGCNRFDFSERQFKVLTLAPRVAAVISLGCAVYMAKLAWQSRTRLYHRIIFCLSMHLILFSLLNMYGSSAMPSDTPDVWGARGTVQTCALQGFGLQVSIAIPHYYVCLSIYSFMAVRHNFDVSKYLWVEKWIHIGVHVFPFGSAIYLLLVNGFNPSLAVCWIESIPFGCGKGTEVPCERGPQNIFVVALICAFLPVALSLLIPTCVMGALYLETRRRQSAIHLEASSVAKQACLYLLALYWSYIFSLINGFIWWYMDKPKFVPTILASVTLNLLGVWILAIYLYFRVVPSRQRSSRQRSASASSQHLSVQHLQSPNATKTVRNTTPRQEGKTIEPTLILEEQSPSSSCEQLRSSFNIFDGTNATGDFAEFVYQGDSDDEKEEIRESMRWQTIQEYIR